MRLIDKVCRFICKTFSIVTKYSFISKNLKCDHYIKQVLFILTSGEPSVNRIDLPAFTLAGPTRNKPVFDPLAVIHTPQESTLHFTSSQGLFYPIIIS